MNQARVRDLGAVQVELRQVLERLQVYQTGVGNRRVRHVQVLQGLERLHVLESLVRDLGAADFEDHQVDGLEVLQSLIRNAGVGQDEGPQVRQFAQVWQTLVADRR